MKELPKDILDQLEHVCEPSLTAIRSVYSKLERYAELSLIKYGYSVTKGRYYDADNFGRQKKIRTVQYKELRQFIKGDYYFDIEHPSEILKTIDPEYAKIITGKSRSEKISKAEKEEKKQREKMNKDLTEHLFK